MHHAGQDPGFDGPVTTGVSMDGEVSHIHVRHGCGCLAPGEYISPQGRCLLARRSESLPFGASGTAAGAQPFSCRSSTTGMTREVFSAYSAKP